MGEVGYWLANKFDASLAIYSTEQVSIPWIDHALGQPHNAAYLPNPFSVMGTDMNFLERLINFVVTNFFHYGLTEIYIRGKVNALLDKHFPGEERPSLTDLERNASVAFGFGSPHILDGWRPTVPNYVDLGMMNCRY